jgi:hypothetical protein
LAYLSNPPRNATGRLLRHVNKRGIIELAYKPIHILNAAIPHDLMQIGGDA